MDRLGSVVARLGLLMLFLGGLNWGLVGLGIMLGQNMNMVNFLLGTTPQVEAIIYMGTGLLSFGGFYYLGQLD